MPVGEGEDLAEVGEVRGLGFFNFHGKVWFRDCRPFSFGMGLMISLFCFFLDMFICGLKYLGPCFAHSEGLMPCNIG